MTRPNRFIVRMLAFLIFIGVLLAPLAQGLLASFYYNPGLNGLVLGLLVAGIAINLRQVLLLAPEVAWIDALAKRQPPPARRLRLLAPLAGMMKDGIDEVGLSAVTLRSVLDSISSRLDEQRDLGRYFVSILIFLGLLGTFWGLSHAVGSMGDVIASLSLSGGDANAAFEKLKSGMEAPLGGMGMAFSTSLFGLAGSLILGFLDLQAGHAQNTFFNELEDWLASRAQLGPATDATTDLATPAYIHALLERTAERLDDIGRTIALAEQGRLHTTALMEAVAHRLTHITDLLRADQALVARLGETETQVAPLLARLVDETVKSREHVVSELQAELRLVARALSKDAGSGLPPPIGRI